MTITWNVDALDHVLNVNIVLRSYQETDSNYFIRDIVLASDVLYASGTWSGSSPADIQSAIAFADVGYFGVLESQNGETG